MEPSLSGDNPLHPLHHPHHHPHHHLHHHGKPPAAASVTTAASASSPSHPAVSQQSMGTPQQQQHRAHEKHEDRPPGAPASSMAQATVAAAPASSAPPAPAATAATTAAPGIGVASHRDSSGALSSLGSASDLSTSATSPRERHWRLDHSQFAAARKDPAEALSSASSSTAGRGPWLLRSNSKHAISGYYRRQNEMIDGFSEMDALSEQLLPPSLSEEREAEKLAKSERFAIRLSNYCNIFLLVAKIVAAVQSRSLSIIASALDSLLDLLSGFILWYTAWSMRRQNPYKYPIGKKRMQPLGIIVFASIMAMLGLQILVEAVRQLFSSEHNVGLGENWQVYVGIMVLAIAIKLGLFLYCRQFDNDIVAAYAQDHFFDVVTNVIGLAAAVLAGALAWWIDPVGAILLSLYTMVNWGRTVQENVRSLTGRTAPPEFLQKLTYLCWNHHEAILMIDTVRAYTFGNSYFTEVDVVLPREMPLQEAHDIGESLQNKLERLPEIERAFVHLDYEVSHRPEHHHHYSTFVVPPGGATVARDPEETVVTPRDEDESDLSGKGRHPHCV